MAWSTVLLALVSTAGVTSDGESTFDKLQKDEEKVRESSSTKVRLARFWKHWHETHPGEKQRHQVQKSIVGTLRRDGVSTLASAVAAYLAHTIVRLGWRAFVATRTQTLAGFLALPLRAGL